jgi:mitogen-activated protein kinase 7
MWSVGCIFAEMLGGKPLFKGRDCKYITCYEVACDRGSKLFVSDVDQLNQILGILGTPDEATLRRVGSERV